MLGEKIKLYRESKNMTQGEIAEILGVKAATISKYEAGSEIRYNPTSSYDIAPAYFH